MTTKMKRKNRTIVWVSLLAYAVLVGSVVLALFSIRESTLAESDDEQSRIEWQKWKAEAAQQDGTRSPVQRSVPKTDEPPLHLLARDHFPAMVVGLILPLTALYWFIVWLVRGVMNSPGPAQE